MLYQMFVENLKFDGAACFVIGLLIVIIAFAAALVIGLFFDKNARMIQLCRTAIKNPTATKSVIRRMPHEISTAYNHAGSLLKKPSEFVTRELMVEKPARTSAISKLWLVTMFATIIGTLMCYFLCGASSFGWEAQEQISLYTAPLLVMIIGCAFVGISKLVEFFIKRANNAVYDDFAVTIDGGKVETKAEKKAEKDKIKGVVNANKAEAARKKAEAMAQLNANKPVKEKKEKAPKPEKSPKQEKMAESHEEVSVEAFSTPETFEVADSFDAVETFDQPNNDEFEVLGAEPKNTVDESFEPLASEPVAFEEPVSSFDNVAAEPMFDADVKTETQEASEMTAEPAFVPEVEEPVAAAFEEPKAEPVIAAEPVVSATAVNPTDAFIESVKQALEKGATNEELRELRDKVAKERANPTTTPEQKKELFTLFTKLIKAMATK